MSSTLQARHRRAVGTIALLGAALVWGATVGPGVATAQTPSDGAADMRTISVTGSGTAEVVPDIARISVGVATRGRDATEASSRAAEQMQAVIDALVGAGVAEADIQTSRVDLQPLRRRDRSGEGTRPIIGWQASNRVSATVRDIDTTGDVIDAAIAAGATDVGNIAFRKDDPSAAEAEARQAAVDDAATTAGQLATAAGVDIIGVANITEGDNGDAVRFERSADFAAPLLRRRPRPSCPAPSRSMSRSPSITRSADATSTAGVSNATPFDRAVRRALHSRSASQWPGSPLDRELPCSHVRDPRVGPGTRRRGLAHPDRREVISQIG